MKLLLIIFKGHRAVVVYLLILELRPGEGRQLHRKSASICI